MTTATRPRKSRASRAADQAAQDQGQQQPEQAQPEPEPKAAEPYALVDAETYPRTFYRPNVRICVPDGKGGETVETITDCEHTAKYGHESEKAALACARRIAAARGLKVGAGK